jgi:hypothetical protein
LRFEKTRKAERGFGILMILTSFVAAWMQSALL